MLTSIIPNPLHPAIVHLPMAIVVLLPLTMAGALWAIKRGAAPFRAWGVAAALHATLVLSAWASLATGDPAKDQVEKVIAEAPIETHEEAAEAFLVMAAGALLFSAVGLRRDRIGTIARGTAAVGSVALFAAGWNVGHSGGELVYGLNAGAAYATTGGAAQPAATAMRERDDDR
ncbi:MAG: hypothetical protein KA154_07935 [Gemmatimonadaceae bacterium]|jgi:hypothetical protein|nr:hypothetical protein [Gemmatimonadaceae bacterium]MCC6431567.1 hypothetical protein [Gemmatimonadaceae bacterium]